MNQSRYVIPKPVGKLLSLLPAYPGSLLFVTALNMALLKNLPADVRASLADKKLRITVNDAHLSFDFKWMQKSFTACRNMGEADLTISASAHDFLLLAQRQEDPDTLFFSRRLSMEGDTELGLLVKNTIDAIELPVFHLGQISPESVLARMKAKLKV
ncbi:SCP2 sterol-binding domain-containing protein [Herminiimonas sp. CN]|uniref:ubiquinone anaerobic biosynthesis accessory factor UbiT n=1 Tax=Herminiimonas sp. CN TaxID=1349818 RepID=UPI0004743BA8